MYRTIYCDLDGVIANFHLEAVRAHLRMGRRIKNLVHYGAPIELSWETLRSQWPMGTALHEFLTNTGPVDDYWSEKMDEFWQPIRHDPLFWRNVPPFPWLRDLVNLLVDNCEELVFVTTPDITHESYGGKRFWFNQQRLHTFELITMKQKWRLATKYDLLIDDHHGHVDSWQKHGPALLFPQPWNHNHAYHLDPVSYVSHCL